jgi:hypothetical protein
VSLTRILAGLLTGRPHSLAYVASAHGFASAQSRGEVFKDLLREAYLNRGSNQTYFVAARTGMHAQLLFDYAKGSVTVSVELGCRMVVVKDQGLACRGFVL